MPSRKTLFTAILTLAVAALIGGAALWFANGRQGPLLSGTALIGGPFELTDQNGKRVTDRDFLGKYMLIFFGFTYCPDVCPGELQVVSAAMDKLGDKADRIVPIFVSIDPARDTAEVMKEYVSNFNPRLVGLTGSPEDIAKIASVYRVYYAKVKGTGDEANYLMDHSTILYLMGPDGKYVTHFTYGAGIDALVTGLQSAVR